MNPSQHLHAALVAISSLGRRVYPVVQTIGSAGVETPAVVYRRVAGDRDATLEGYRRSQSYLLDVRGATYAEAVAAGEAVVAALDADDRVTSIGEPTDEYEGELDLYRVLLAVSVRQ